MYIIKKAPDLPATMLVSSCYRKMFRNCSKLSYVKIDYTGGFEWTFFGEWVKNTANSGTFYYNGDSSAEDFGFSPDWTIRKFI